ncbi:hypothetical protein VNI00_009945 [Paramarasmius palmivorus]|uniref:Uncharacterized protein n=1 Tax=Paramarasmius palmivorus TaxID=297713 RepID=A0AAW0CMB7_9AGAR
MDTTSPSLQAAVEQLISAARNESADSVLKKRIQDLELQIKRKTYTPENNNRKLIHSERDANIRTLRDTLANITTATPHLSAPSDSVILRANRTHGIEDHAFFPFFSDEGWPERLDFHAQMAFAIMRDLSGISITGVEATEKKSKKLIEYKATCMMTSSREGPDGIDDTLTVHFELHFTFTSKGGKQEKMVQYRATNNDHIADTVLKALGQLTGTFEFPTSRLTTIYAEIMSILRRGHEQKIQEEVSNGTSSADKNVN